jgi:hypothetical protein
MNAALSVAKWLLGREGITAATPVAVRIGRRSYPAVMNVVVAKATMQQFWRKTWTVGVPTWLDGGYRTRLFLFLLLPFVKPRNSSHFRPSQGDCPWARSKNSR